MPPLDFAESHPQKSERSQIVITNGLHFGAFDKSDEAMLNDYEELMGLLRTGEAVALDFSEIVLSFLSEDPPSLEKPVEQEWSDTPVDSRLVFASPVPPNEEQRKILAALRQDQCRFLAIEGPPGCGKSHTIVAIVFEAILTGRNVLVLSDKKEALDVVEDKLTKVLNAVWTGADFQNPAGKSRQHLRQDSERSGAGGDHRPSSRGGRASGGAARSDHGRGGEAQNGDQRPDSQRAGDRPARGCRPRAARERVRLYPGARRDFKRRCEAPRDRGRAQHCRMARRRGPGADAGAASHDAGAGPRRSCKNSRITTGPCGDAGAAGDDLEAVGFFTGFAPHCQDVLEDFIRQYHSAKQPLFGFVFRRARAPAIDQELGRQLPCRSAIEAHRRIGTLVRAARVLSSLRASFGKAGIAVEHHHWAYQQVIDKIAALAARAPEILKKVVRLRDALGRDPEFATSLGIEADDLGWVGAAAAEGSLLARLGDFAADYRRMGERFGALPEFDYVGEKRRLESLHTQRLAHTIDERVVDFANEHKNLARALRDIIRKRQRFPRGAFEHLKKAFPCMIAGIRDYAEYVPLEQGLFDLVIIDEASQVSIAQAFPAFVRVRELVVLGDRRQFSNVKTANASREINAKYAHEIIENFRRGTVPDTDTMNRLRMFNIKVSVLEFIERISNYNALLKSISGDTRSSFHFLRKPFTRGSCRRSKSAASRSRR
jgi:hypothetical protein